MYLLHWHVLCMYHLIYYHKLTYVTNEAISLLTVTCMTNDVLWPPCVADADIIFLPCGFFFFLLFFFPRLISTIAGCMSTILTHMVWPYCEFRMQVWNVLHVAHWNCRTQNEAKIRHLGTIAQLCWALYSQLKHVSTVGKKLIKQQCLPHISSQYSELWPTSGWDLLASLGHPVQISTGFASWQRYCTAL